MDKQIRKLVLPRAILVGFCGGIIWGIFYLIMYLFNMVEIDHLAILRKWFQDEWINRWYAHLIFLIMLSIVSILFALLYYYLLRKMKSWVVGGLYGIALAFIVYFIIPLITTGFNSFEKFHADTHIGIVCTFLLYGVFVGYTISYDEQHMRHELEQKEETGEFHI